MRRLRRGLLGLLLVPAVARPGTLEDLAEAQRLLRETQDEQAVQVLTRALDRGDHPPPQKAQLFVLLGLARLNLRDEEGARLAFLRAYDADPAATMPGTASPKALRAFEEVRAARERERAALPRPSAPPMPPPAPSAPIEAPARVERKGVSPRRVAGFGALAAGLGSAGVGAVLSAAGARERQRAVDEPDAMAAHKAYQAAVGAATMGTVALALAAAASLAGVGLLLWPDAPAAVTLAPHGAAFAVRF